MNWRGTTRIASASHAAQTAPASGSLLPSDPSTKAPSPSTSSFASAAQHASKVGWVLKLGQSIAAEASEDDQCCSGTSRSAHVERQLLGELRQCLTEEQSRALADDFLLKCLAQYHWDVPGAASVAKGFLSFRHSVRWPLRVPAADVTCALRTGMHWLLPARPPSSQISRWASGGGDELGPAACLVYNAGKLDPSVCSIEEYQKMGTFLIEHATDGLACRDRGVALIVDCGGVDVAPMLRIMGLDDLRRGVLMWKGAFPCRLRRLWVVDAPSGSQVISTSILRMLAPRVRERVRFAYRSGGLGDLETDLGSRFVMPPSLGGRPGEFDWERQVATLTHPAESAQTDCRLDDVGHEGFGGGDGSDDEEVASI